MKPICFLKHRIRSCGRLCGLLTVFFLCCAGNVPAVAESTADTDLIHPPVQITSRTEAVLDMAISADGAYIVYVSGDEKPTTLWLGSADPSVILLPEKLAGGFSVKSSPAISADGRYVAYVDTDFDVKGDIYVMDRQKPKEEPVRLTGRDTEDGGPCFSEDGRFLYFHQAKGNRPRGLVVMDLANIKKGPAPIPTGGDAMFCAISPDKKHLAFVSAREDASGDIFIMDTRTQLIRKITGGPAIDMFPQWSRDSGTLYFSRIGSDTTRDRRLTSDDHSIVCRVRLNDASGIPFPLTPLNYVSFKPFAAEGRIYFLSGMAGVGNCWCIPENGMIRNEKSADDQLLTARKIASRIPYDPYLTLLAHITVVERFSDQEKTAAAAGLAAAGVFAELDLPASAQGAYQFVRTQFGAVLPESRLAEIRQIGVEFRLARESAVSPDAVRRLFEQSLARLNAIADTNTDVISAAARLESTALVVEHGDTLADLTKAIAWTDAVLTDKTATGEQKTEALFLKARIFEQTATPVKVVDTLRKIILDHPGVRNWVDKAVVRIIDTVLTDFANQDMDKKIQKLQLEAMENRDAAPPLAMGALNRIGDLYYASGDLAQAKAAYQHVLDTFPELTTQTAAARLSLAEILFRDEEFRQAINLYETEISLRDSTDRIYHLARQGYIRKTVAAGEFYFRLGEIPSARSTFKELLDYDAGIVEAHRGYIKCAAASGDIETVLNHYKKERDAAPDDPVKLYAYGLCLTYRDTPESAREAQKLIETAVRYNGNVEYFHQTLGYVYEVMETVHGKSRYLERALMAYQKAYFLNDPLSNSENAANLELNLGNVYYLLGQYGKAYEFYLKRRVGGVEFSDPTTRIVFLKRLGESAFQNNDIETAISAYTEALTHIDTLIDPAAPSRAYDRLNRYLADHITRPAANHGKTKAMAEELAEKQSLQNLKAAEFTGATAPPPSEKWQTYRKNMERLLDAQETLNASAVALARKFNAAAQGTPGFLPVERPRENLANLVLQTRKALDFPERLMELKAETSDRLALAFQENQDFGNAAEMFAQVFYINEKTGKFENLARNRRSVAYNTYQQAKTRTGEARVRLLEQAGADFRQVLVLIDEYGVPAPAEREKSALINLSFQTSLNAATATQAAKGFSEIQERRLVETFLSRIDLELGHLRSSRETLEKQLSTWPSVDKVTENDRFGVSLLYHRSGLLDHATGNDPAAFEKFAVSAELSLKLENPKSAATNLENMAAAAGNFPDAMFSDRMPRFFSLDRQTTALLHQKAGVTGIQPVLRYHAILGVFYYNAAQRSAGSLEASVARAVLEQAAIGHFSRGIALFEENVGQIQGRGQRNDLAAGAALYLDMGFAAKSMQEYDTARQHFEKAYALSDTGVLPDLEWRAQLGLDRVENALAALETVPLSRAGCGPGEIIGGFGSLVFDKLSKGDPEGAFALAERISEIERFHRTNGFVRPKDAQEQAFFRALYPRLEQIKSLEKQMAGAASDERPLIEKRLETERSLLADAIGPDNKNLPVALKDISDRHTQNSAVWLLALSEKIEEISEDLAAERIKIMNENKTGDRNQDAKARTRAESIKDSRDGLVKTYRRFAEDAFYSRPASAPPDMLTLLSPQPCETPDIMEALSEDDAVARIFHSGRPGDPFALFLITPEEMTAFTFQEFDAVKSKIAADIDWTIPYVACETPESLDMDILYPRVLSATHLLRCINSRKPFKQKFLAVPPAAVSDIVARDYDIRTYTPGNKADSSILENELLTANTLFFSDGPILAATVPAESGEIARPFFAVYTDADTRKNLDHLLIRTENLSLALAGAGPADQTFVLGHLFSIFRCPALVFVEPDPASAPPPNPAEKFLGSYAEKSGLEAFRAMVDAKAAPPEASFRPSKTPLYLGYQGMNRKQSAAFAKKQFVDYVKSGRAAFDRENFAAATVGFENAISVAEEISTYSQYLPDLYKYARESAYRSGNNTAALKFAKELAGLMADTEQNTKNHAEALLRLGLMQAKDQTYQEAIAAIETAVRIMEALPPDQDLINAITDLGIVLENATDYETALSRFRSAADLSLTLDQSRLLGEQHLHMGRVYDLRLNQYATAIVHYEKALEIFNASGDVEKIAEASLDIGRCHRLLGNFPRADHFYSQSMALILAKAPEQHLLLAKILIEQANNAWFQGNYESALTLQRRCYDISREHDFSLLQVMSLNTAGLIWWTLGDYDKALAELADALDHAERLAIRKDEISSTLNNMGLIYRERGDYERALETFAKAVAIDTELSSKWGLAYDFRNQGLTYLKMNQPQKAADLFDEAYALADGIGNRINASKALLGKGEALILLKNTVEAEKAYDQALIMSREMRLSENIWRALFGKAKIQLEFHKNSEQAEILLREAVEVIETLRSDLKIERLRENFLTDKLAVYEALVRLLADTGKPVAAFEMAERSRSRNFIDLLGTGRIDFSDDTEGQLFRRQHFIRSEIETYASLLAASSDEREKAAYEKSMASLHRDLENISIDMQLKNPQLATLVTVPPVDMDQLFRWMEPGVALVSYYLLDNEVFCWVLTSPTTDAPLPLTLVRIPADRALLEKQILEYRRIIQNLEPWEKHAKILYDQLVAPVLPELKGIQTLGVIPHGSLHYLSFATLYTGKNFLLEDFALFYLPSAGVLEYTLSRRGTEPKTIPKVLAIGNPDLGDPVLDLPFAEQEVYSIQWNFPEVTLLTRERATKAWVMDNISRFNIVHFASHGEFDPVNPLLSAIKLAGARDNDFTKPDKNGNLEAGEIFGLKIKADMVFLSACQTGLGKITAGDDVIGLNRSFFFAGTHTLVSSLWRVSDVSTAVLIKTFYRRYMTADKADSLKQAAMHVKSRYPHPGYWGAFTLVGDYL